MAPVIMDVVIAIFLLAGVFIGYVQGAIRQALWLIALYISMVVSVVYHGQVAAFITNRMSSMSAQVAQVLAFFLLLFACAYIFSFITWDIVRRQYEKSQTLSVPTHVFGGLLGVVSTVVLISVGLLALKLVSLVPWPGAMEDIRQGVLSGQDGSRVAALFRSVIPILASSMKYWSPNLPPIFTVFQ